MPGGLSTDFRTWANYLQDFISYKNYTVGTDEDENVFYGVCLTPNTDYIKIEIYW